MKTIPLTQGKVALVDDEDYERVNAHKWCAQRSGSRWYAVRWVYRNGRRTLERMHRFVLGAGDSLLDVDHLNGDGLDNRLGNIRLATRSENMRNQAMHRAGRLPGSCFHRHLRARPWEAYIRLDGRLRHLGYFATEEDAHERFLIADAARRSRMAPPRKAL
jgi:hypothetical protein